MDLRIDDKGKYFTARVVKDPLMALIRTADHIIVGNIYVRPDHRLRDELCDDDSRFLPITDAMVYDAASEELLYQSQFLLLAYTYIVMVGPLDSFEPIRQVPWQKAREL